MFGRTHKQGKPGNKTRGRRFMAKGRKNLMQNPMPKPTFQAKVGGIIDRGTGKTPAITALGASKDAVTGIGPIAPALNRQAVVYTLPRL